MNLAHFDLKPSNILVFDEGFVKLTDFQLAKPCAARVEVHNEGTMKYELIYNV